MERRSPAEVSASPGLDIWRVGSQAMYADLATATFEAGIELVDRIAAAADAADHHPDLTITYSRVRIRLTTHDAGGLTDRDVELARDISAIARELGIRRCR